MFAIVGFVGTRITRGLLEPLGQLEKDIDQLAKGNTQVRLHALSRTDEIGRIARSMAKIQESLVELARIKTQRFVSSHPGLVSSLKDMWDGVKSRRAQRPGAAVLGRQHGRQAHPEVLVELDP